MRIERKPIFCYVTDRRSFELVPASIRPERGRVLLPEVNSLHDSISRVIFAGVNWIQIREKDLDTRTLLEIARFAVAKAHATSTRVLINDRLDVALAAHAAGVHLGEKSLPLESVAAWRRTSRRTDFQIGVSCHSLESACAAESGGADYVFFGPVFATPSKAAFGAPQGIDRLREVCASVKIPVLAIGGVNPENTRDCLKAGASGIAAIRLFQNAKDSDELTASLKRI
ncbi:MAG TPA: thiamine phosphate synthase [Candidatus Acidoferrales bacterium]|nr:thiamine phosphate synthase [Candidatus Acidoferrales bacterium]